MAIDKKTLKEYLDLKIRFESLHDDLFQEVQRVYTIITKICKNKYMWDCFEDFEIDGFNVTIQMTEYGRCGNRDEDWYETFPLSYLYNDEVEEIIELKWTEEEKKRKEDDKLRKTKITQDRENAEIQHYLDLKEKFEKRIDLVEKFSKAGEKAGEKAREKK